MLTGVSKVVVDHSKSTEEKTHVTLKGETEREWKEDGKWKHELVELDRSFWVTKGIKIGPLADPDVKCKVNSSSTVFSGFFDGIRAPEEGETIETLRISRA